MRLVILTYDGRGTQLGEFKSQYVPEIGSTIVFRDTRYEVKHIEAYVPTEQVTTVFVYVDYVKTIKGI